MSPLPLRIILFAAALLARPGCVLAQPSASASASASAQIVDPVGILHETPGSSADAPAGGAAGMAPLSGGVFSIRGPANQVVSVSVGLPANVERAEGGPTLPVTAPLAAANRIMPAAGAAAFDVAGAAPVQGASGGVYAGTAQVVVNLN